MTLASSQPSLWARVAPVVAAAALPVAALVGILATADVRLPVGLPGHRGLIWLTLLVAVALTARRPGVVTAVGLAATTCTLLGLVPLGGSGPLRYVLAAVLLDVLASRAVVRSRPWLLAAAAAPVHLVALVGPVAAPGVAVVLGHLVWGLVAGGLGLGIAALAGRRR